MKGRNRNPPWSDLPPELLSAIANTLTLNPISIITFRSICRSWRSSCPPLSHSSILSPILPFPIPLPGRNSYDLYSYISVTIIYAVHRPLQSPGIEFSSLSPDAWILFVDEFIPGKLRIRKPFSSASYSTPINFPNNISLLDFNVHELGRFHNLSYSTYGGRPGAEFSKRGFYQTADVDKVVMFPNALAAIALQNDGTLWMYRLNVGTNEGIYTRESKHDGKGFRFDDIVEYKGRVLGIDRRGRVYEIKYDSSVMIPFVLAIAGGGGWRKRLVESLGGLYLVARCKEKLDNTEKRPKFKVYELNQWSKKQKWCEITSLGDRSFLFGTNFSFSASAQELGAYVKNCILFAKNSFRTYNGNDDDYKEFSKLKNSQLDIGVWPLDNTVPAIESYPEYSDSLWPPPGWIWNIDRLKRIGILEAAITEILSRRVKPVDTNWQLRFLEAGNGDVVDETDVGDLKNRATIYHVEETAVMHDLRESMVILNKANNVFEQPGTSSSHRTIEEIDGWPDNLKTSATCQDPLLRSTVSMLRKRDACLFSIEEQTTKVKTYLKAMPWPILA